MISRRSLVSALASAFALPGAVHAQPTDKIWRIGYIGITAPGVSPEAERLVDAFVKELSSSGVVVGKNAVLERRALEGRNERATALVAELIGLRVDVLVVYGTAAAQAAKAATTIPVVMVAASDPVASGLVASLARPGGNVTGLTDFEDDLYPKRFELLKAAAPRTIRIGFVQDDHSPRFFDTSTYEALKRNEDTAARGLGLSLLRVPMNAPRDFGEVTATLTQGHVDALLLTGQAAYVMRKELGEFAIHQRLPSMVAVRVAGTGGALMSFGADYSDIWRKAANYVSKILAGARPGDLPVERPTKVELVINLKTAKAIGLTIPQSLLLRADEVIE